MPDFIGFCCGISSTKKRVIPKMQKATLKADFQHDSILNH